MELFRTLVCCPNCLNDISLEEGRAVIPAIPLPDQSTAVKKVSLVYTVCPKCKRDFRAKGERLAASVVLALVFLLLASSFFVDSWIPLALVVIVLIFQKKIAQIFIRAERS